MLALVVAVMVLVGGIYLLFRRAISFGVAALPFVLTWLIAVIVLITYAEQHDDLWQQYAGNAIMGLAGVVSAVVSAVILIQRDLSQRFIEHINATNKLFEQFEKRSDERLDNMAEKVSDLKKTLEGIVVARSTKR